MAYNEAANIGRLLEGLLNQKTEKVAIDRIIVVASGCTDGTEDIVCEIAQKDSRVELLVQEKREGKASAVNLFMRNIDHKIVVMQSADTVPVEGTIEALVSPFEDPNVGMVGGHPIPTNLDDTFIGFGINLLWDLHHLVSLRYPKIGELIAFRNIFYQIPNETAVDEASIEPLVIGQGMRLAYAPEALVYNRGPENIRDFIKQRRRIFAGHLYVKETLGYKVSTMNGARIVRLYLQNAKFDWRYFIWGPGIVVLEVFVRLLATYDYLIMRRNPFSWAIAESTKKLPEII
ncbi:MAG: glycosyltransferase [Anaerolineales bacterium]|nr:glycosyltransferase [Anaerolineales bacterium]